MIHLKIHVESIHEGVRYPCDKCPYKATTISSLKRHGESIHEGVCYSCHGGGDSPVFLKFMRRLLDVLLGDFLFLVSKSIYIVLASEDAGKEMRLSSPD